MLFQSRLPCCLPGPFPDPLLFLLPSTRYGYKYLVVGVMGYVYEFHQLVPRFSSLSLAPSDDIRHTLMRKRRDGTAAPRRAGCFTLTTSLISQSILRTGGTKEALSDLPGVIQHGQRKTGSGVGHIMPQTLLKLPYGWSHKWHTARIGMFLNFRQRQETHMHIP